MVFMHNANFICALYYLAMRAQCKLNQVIKRGGVKKLMKHNDQFEKNVKIIDNVRHLLKRIKAEYK